MKKMKSFAGLLLAIVLLTACSSKPSMKAGDSVIADWYEDTWHVGKLVAECEGGWTVDFKDDFYDSGEGQEPACYAPAKLVVDVAPVAADVKVDGTVLAQWVEDSYYTAKIVKIDGDKYSVKFVSDGWESELKLDQLRLLPVVEAAK